MGRANKRKRRERNRRRKRNQKRVENEASLVQDVRNSRKDSEAHVSVFEELHSFSFPSWWKRGRELISSVLVVRAAADRSLVKVTQGAIATEPTFGLLYHLAERVYEQLAASIVCFATSNGAGAEVTARAALELSVSLRFCLREDRNSRILAWLRNFIEHDESTIRRWENSIGQLPSSEREAHQRSIKKRRELHIARKELVGRLEREFVALGVLIDSDAKWPNVFDRFRSIDDEVGYRTAYSRLSSQTHSDAEDTINYIIASRCEDKNLAQSIGLETVAFSEYLVLYAVRAYFISLRELCSTFGAPRPNPELAQGCGDVEEKMGEISTVWGW